MKTHLLKAVAVLLLATPAFGTFTFTNSELLSLGKISGSSAVTLFTNPDSNYGGTTFQGSVGYRGTLDKNESVYIGTTDQIVLDAAALDGTYSLNLANDNDDIWEVALQVEHAGDGHGVHTGSFVSLNGGDDFPTNQSTVLSLDLSSFDSLTSIGFVVRQVDDSFPDTYHVSATVPAPGALLLGSLGVSLVGYLRRRRAL